MFENTNILIGLVSALFGIGFAVGLTVSKYQTKEKCEMIKQACSCEKGIQEKRLEGQILKVEEKVEKMNGQFMESTKRVHERLDEVLVLLGAKKRINLDS
jgi:hypothetical protein